MRCFAARPADGPAGQGARDGSGLVKRDGYPEPCKYTGTEYAQLDAPHAMTAL